MEQLAPWDKQAFFFSVSLAYLLFSRNKGTFLLLSLPPIWWDNSCCFYASLLRALGFCVLCFMIARRRRWNQNAHIYPYSQVNDNVGRLLFEFFFSTAVCLMYAVVIQVQPVSLFVFSQQAPIARRHSQQTLSDVQQFSKSKEREKDTRKRERRANMGL